MIKSIIFVAVNTNIKHTNHYFSSGSPITDRRLKMLIYFDMNNVEKCL